MDSQVDLDNINEAGLKTPEQTMYIVLKILEGNYIFSSSISSPPSISSSKSDSESGSNRSSEETPESVVAPLPIHTLLDHAYV
jgi:hypothetical protein